MTSMPRSILELSAEELEAESDYEAAKRETWEPTVEAYAREFYQDVRAPTPYDPFEITSTMKPHDEQHKYTFDVQLWKIAGHRSRVTWVMPGQVEVIYIVDGREWRRKTLNLILEPRYGAGVGTFIDDMDDTREELTWNNFLLILLKFDANTIRYYNPIGTSRAERTLEVVGEVMKRHYEIYASPQASLGSQFEDLGYCQGEQENQELSSSESDASTVSY